ncbi:hypothetical protein D0T50_03560 [Bacteroides sp. 214]|uniref:hypothetical protein n=1 Tax=Bacteroides sp. 214 TaxID=2302935 RepID=UPI0013D3696F|nr:hypothetical protein [Bacteroides sp. 214]NDW11966.1 hypothetical protein [Bacteroides sp. 214]
MAKKRLSDKEFWTVLRENAGLYARTARAITKIFGIPYTRQSVKARAEKKPELLDDILEENFDIAEEGLHSLMRSKNESVRFRAVEFFLKTKGKERGYVERTELTGKDSKDLFGQLSDDELDARIVELERRLEK